MFRFSTKELEARFDIYRSEQESARQAMEKRHAEELAKLRSDKKDMERTFDNKVNDLSWKLDLQIQQNQQKQNTLKTEKDEEVAKKQEVFEKILEEIRRKQEEQEKLLSDQGNSKLLQKKVEQLEKEQKDAKQKYEREKHELESKFSNQLQSLAQDKFKLETELQQKQRALEKEFTEKQAALEESLRIKQLAELSKIEDNEYKTRANFRNDCEYFHNSLSSKRSKQS